MLRFRKVLFNFSRGAATLSPSAMDFNLARPQLRYDVLR